jgi:hypothetical protein
MLNTATVGFHSFPCCETDDRVKLQFSAKLSVPHSFEVITLTLTRSVCRTVIHAYVSFCSDINPRFLLTRESLEGITVRRPQRI